MKMFIETPFGYCPFTWMFRSRIVNMNINHLHERAYELFIKIILVFSKTYVKGINLLLFTIGTFSHWV